MSVDYSKIPEHCRESLRLYVEEGAPTGSFLLAVLSNDLVEAFKRADATNSVLMREYASWLYYECPSKAWGSDEAITAWVEEHEARRQRMAAAENAVHE